MNLHFRQISSKIPILLNMVNQLITFPLASTGILAIAIILLALGLFSFVIYSIWNNYISSLEQGQSVITDKDLLLLFEQQPDGFLTKKEVMELTGLTKKQSTQRLQHLQMNQLLRASYTSSFRYYYKLYQPIDHREPPKLSNAPFLTVEDVLLLFKHFNYEFNLQDLVIATGLPLLVIKREMKYFVKEKIIEMLYTSMDAVGTTMKTYILREPYRSDPDKFLAMEGEINPQLEKIYDELYV